MHSTKSNLSSTKVTLTITAAEPDLEPIKKAVVTRLGENVKIAGFREGKAPLQLIERSIDQNRLQADFLDEALTQLYAKASAEHKVSPVTKPEVDVKKFVPFSILEFSVTTDVIGEIKLPDYKKLKVDNKTKKITPKDVDQVVESVRKQLGTKNPVDRAAKIGDEVEIDFSAVDSENKPVPGADGKAYPLELGSKNFIPGFEEELVGLKKGQEKTFKITFPKDYGSKDLAGQQVQFTVKVNEIRQLELPKLDDEMAAKAGPFKTVDELKTDIRKELEARAEREGISEQQNSLLELIIDKSNIELPDALVEQQVTYNTDELRRRITQQGMTFEEYLKNSKKTESEYNEEAKKQAARQLKGSLILTEIANLEKLTISSEELQVRISGLKSMHKDEAMQRQLDNPENQNEIASRMLSEKVMNFLISSSETTGQSKPAPASKKSSKK